MKKTKVKIILGKVISDKMDKTAVVLVERSKKHRLYHKNYKVSKKFKVHDENNQAKIGDMVKIVPSKPESKTKKWRLLEVIKAK